jgi:hypothetical protein
LDWDHLAALTDIVGAESNTARALICSVIYAVGHALVVLLLGFAALMIGFSLPKGIDGIMETVVGVTLVGLSVWLVICLAREGENFAMRSRIAAVTELFGLLKDAQSARSRSSATPGKHHSSCQSVSSNSAAGARATGKSDELAYADHTAVDQCQDPPGTDACGTATGASGACEDQAGCLMPPSSVVNQSTSYLACLAVGAVHGIGAETPTQAVTLVAVGASRELPAFAILFSFVFGMFVSNMIVALIAALGYKKASGAAKVRRSLGLATAVASLIVGTCFIFHVTHILPQIAGG